jgi:uncharacterized protein (TIGR02996 family)
MSDKAALLRAIVEQPGDDLPRLAYADWLEENGDPEGAEFVRVQVELPRAQGDRRERLKRREKELLERHKQAWLGEAADVLALDEQYAGWIEFRRGMPEVVALQAHLFPEHGETLWRRCPTLRRALVYEPRGRGAALVCPAMGRFREVVLADWITAEDARALAAGPPLGALEKLELWVGHRDDQTVCETLAASAVLPRLREVVLVQHLGGMLAGEEAYERRRRADAQAVLFAARGVRANVHRPFDQTFPLAPRVNSGIFAGRLLEGRLAVVGVQYYGHYATVAVLDGDGLMLEDQRHELRGVLRRPPAQSYEHYNVEEVHEYLRSRLGFEPAAIRVGEFMTADGLGVYLYGGLAGEAVCGPDEFDPEDEMRREAGKDVLDWLESGWFVVQFGNDNWADQSGVVHTT